ncbi:MAG: GTP-dependent dephospho-CoA kinase family protein [Candidatus Hadarchaeota archaeon]
MKGFESEIKLPEGMRTRLQRPMGQLFGSVQEALSHIRGKPPRLITVGDRVTVDFILAGARPDLVIVDMKVMRTEAEAKIKEAIESFKAKIVRVKNPAGSITPELVKAIETAEPPTKIIVDGEEDLAALPAVLSAPLGAIVVYGQPKEGLVVIEVTVDKKREFSVIVEKMKSGGS